MTTVNLDEVLSTVSFSRASTFQECQRKWMFRYIWDLEPDVRPTASQFGEAIHQGLDVWHMTRDEVKALEQFRKAWAAHGGDIAEDTVRTTDRGEQVLRNYFSVYEVEPFTVLGSEIELEGLVVKVPSSGREVKLEGRIDKLLDWQGMATLMDHKTTTSLGYSKTLESKPNLQNLAYLWAAKRLLGKDVYQMCMDWLWVPKGTTTRKAVSERYLRKIESFSDEEIAEFPEILGMLLEDIERAVTQERYVPNFGACTNWGECSYRKICVMPRSAWQSIADQMYHSRAAAKAARKETGNDA